jgi:hypothetical protein
MCHSDDVMKKLLSRLRELSSRGPILGVDRGDSSIGLTLLRELGVAHTSSAKPSFEGIAITAARKGSSKANRVNLFAKVPDWTVSECKSSREILQRFGYATVEGELRLYCTVSAKRVNSRGLKLRVRDGGRFLDEVAEDGKLILPVVTWVMPVIQQCLLAAHPESVWVRATVHNLRGREHFHFREATYTGKPWAERLPELFNAGTISVDHLIQQRGGRVSEKGPLFKIGPENLALLFPNRKIYSFV